MFQYVLLLLCLGGSFASPAPKIVNGTNAVEGEIPYIISLRSNNRHSCGGSIVDEYHILTACHCVDGKSPSALSVQYGVLQISSAANVIAVAKITMHPNYISGSGWINDVAILKLVSPIQFSSTVSPVVLPPQGFAVSGWSDAVLSGWGYPYTGGSVMNDLQRVDLLVFPDDDCENAHGGSARRQYHVCAGVIGGGKGQCSGDSGGPLTVQGVQVGVVSWSVKPCTVAGYPGVFARVANYRDWIDTQINL